MRSEIKLFAVKFRRILQVFGSQGLHKNFVGATASVNVSVYDQKMTK